MKSAEAFCGEMKTIKPPRNPVIVRLAKSLAVTYNVPSQDDELVMILGSGHESNNLQAIESWVRVALLDIDEPMALDMLNHLVHRFGETLEQWEVSRW